MVVPETAAAARALALAPPKVFEKRLGAGLSPSVYVIVPATATPEATVKQVVARSARANLPIAFRA
jgi:hypothetical protein